MKTDSKTNRRYYLHQIIKRVGFKYDAHARTVFVHWNYNNNNKFITELRENHQYNVQTEIK